MTGHCLDNFLVLADFKYKKTTRPIWRIINHDKISAIMLPYSDIFDHFAFRKFIFYYYIDCLIFPKVRKHACAFGALESKSTGCIKHGHIKYEFHHCIKDHRSARRAGFIQPFWIVWQSRGGVNHALPCCASAPVLCRRWSGPAFPVCIPFRVRVIGIRRKNHYHRGQRRSFFRFFAVFKPHPCFLPGAQHIQWKVSTKHSVQFCFLIEFDQRFAIFILFFYCNC